MCCAIVAMLLAMFPAWTGGREAVMRWLSNVQHVALAGGAMIAVLAGTGFAASSYPHEAAHFCSVLTGF